jgi:hypothetical protein
MARYYFDILDGEGLAADDEGLELETIEAVYEECARTLSDITRDEVRKVSRSPRRQHTMVIEVRDDLGIVMTVSSIFRIERTRQVH